MVFGLGKKQIEITLEKYNYSPGETIAGKVTLKLKNPVQANQLRVALIGERVTRKLGMISSRGTHPEHEVPYIYNFQMPLDGEKEYVEGEYNFGIKIPANILQATPTAPGGVIGDVAKAVRFLSGTTTRISWYVRATLDIPKKMDISSKNVQINIG